MQNDHQQIHLRLPTQLHEQAKQAAKDDERSVNFIIRKALESYLRDCGYSPDKP